MLKVSAITLGQTIGRINYDSTSLIQNNYMPNNETIDIVSKYS